MNALNGLCGSAKVWHNRLRAIWEAGHKLSQFSKPAVITKSLSPSRVVFLNPSLWSWEAKLRITFNGLSTFYTPDHSRGSTSWQRPLQLQLKKALHVVTLRMTSRFLDQKFPHVSLWYSVMPPWEVWEVILVPVFRLTWQDRRSEGNFWKLRKGFFRRVWRCNVFDANSFRTAESEPVNLFASELHSFTAEERQGLFECLNSQLLLALGSLPR